MKQSDNLDTRKVLEIASDFANEREVDDIVVASTTGETAVQSLDFFSPKEFNLVVVGHSTGFNDMNEQEFSRSALSEVETAGGDVFFGPMIFHNLNSAVARKEGFSSGDLVADTLRLFGQGTKVALECVLMATDAGLIKSGKSVLSIAGTGNGADTVLLIHSANSKNFFDSRIREVIVKPGKVKNMPYY